MKAKIFAVAAVMLFSFGCIEKLAVDGLMIAQSAIKSALKPKPPEAVLVDKEIKKYRIGNYDVGFYEGTFHETPSLLLITKYVDEKKVEKTRTIVFRKNSHYAMKEINNFNQMSESEKRQQIRTWYIQRQDFDLGPDPAGETPAPPPAPPSNS